MKNKSETEKEPSFNINDLKDCSSTPKDVKEKVKINDFREKFLNCAECSYKCKKEKTMKKHILANHEDHQCKECQEKFPAFIELPKHVVKHHFKEQVDIHKRSSDKEAFVKPVEPIFYKQKETEDKGEEKKQSDFKAEESISGEIV